MIPLLTLQETGEDLLEMTRSGASIRLLEDAKRKRGVVSKPSSLFCYIYVADFRGLEALYETDVEEVIAQFLNFTQCELSYCVTR